MKTRGVQSPVFRKLSGSQENLHCYILVSHKTVADVTNVNSSITCLVGPTNISKNFWGRKFWSDLYANCAMNSYKFYTYLHLSSKPSKRKESVKVKLQRVFTSKLTSDSLSGQHLKHSTLYDGVIIQIRPQNQFRRGGEEKENQNTLLWIKSLPSRPLSISNTMEILSNAHFVYVS